MTADTDGAGALRADMDPSVSRRAGIGAFAVLFV